MASLNAHIEKAIHNIKIMAFLATSSGKADWIVTVAFYSALHIVDAVLYHRNEGLRKHGQSHGRREDLIKGDNSMKHIWKCYWPLSNHSIVARYLQYELTPPDVHIAFDQIMPHDRLVEFVKRNLGGLSASASKLLPLRKGQELSDAFSAELKDFLGL